MQLLFDALDKSPNREDRPQLFSAIVASVGQGDRPEASRVAEMMANRLKGESSAPVRTSLIEGLVTLSDRASGPELKTILVAALERETDTDCYRTIRDSLLAVIRRMAPAEAAPLSGRTARWLARSIEAGEKTELTLEQMSDSLKFTEYMIASEAESLCTEMLVQSLRTDIAELNDGRGALIIDPMVPTLLSEIRPNSLTSLPVSYQAFSSGKARESLGHHYWYELILSMVFLL